MNVSIYDTQDSIDKNHLVIDHSSVCAMVKALVSECGVATSEVIVHFVSEKTICDMHEELFDDPTPTDCITIPIDGINPPFPGCDHVLGEMIISPSYAVAHAIQFHHSPIEECSVYLIHSFLHLIGYEDSTPELQKVMFQKQEELFQTLREKNLLLKSSTHYETNR